MCETRLRGQVRFAPFLSAAFGIGYIKKYNRCSRTVGYHPFVLAVMIDFSPQIGGPIPKSSGRLVFGAFAPSVYLGSFLATCALGDVRCGLAGALSFLPDVDAVRGSWF